MLPQTTSQRLILLITVFFAFACNNGSSKKIDKPFKDSVDTIIKKEKEKKEPVAKFERPPIVNIVDSLMPKRTVIYCKDSAATFERVGPKLGKIYGGKLGEYVKKNKLKILGAPMAWYRKLKAPYFFEAGLPVNKKGNRAVAGVQVRELAAGNAIIAHFYGPYELLPQGYDAIKEFMKDHKKVSSGAPFEIYLTDPIDKNGKPVDPYKVQTDIIFPIR